MDRFARSVSDILLLYFLITPCCKKAIYPIDVKAQCLIGDSRRNAAPRNWKIQKTYIIIYKKQLKQ